MADRPPPRLRTVDRQQFIPAMPLEQLLDSDHQARLVWDFCAHNVVCGARRRARKAALAV